jgi:hypothetical protein
VPDTKAWGRLPEKAAPEVANDFRLPKMSRSFLGTYLHLLWNSCHVLFSWTFFPFNTPHPTLGGPDFRAVAFSSK